MTKKKTCAERIIEGMEMRGINQTELAKRTGIPKPSISHYVSGRYVPKQTPTHLIAIALNVSEAWLMGYDVSPERKNLNPDDAETIAKFGKRFASLSDRDREIIISMMDTMIKSYSSDK